MAQKKYVWKPVVIPKVVPLIKSKHTPADAIVLDDTCFVLIRIQKQRIEVGIVKSFRLRRTYIGRNARDLYRTILSKHEFSRLDHAAYLGYELACAEYALKHKLTYVQG